MKYDDDELNWGRANKGRANNGNVDDDSFQPNSCPKDYNTLSWGLIISSVVSANLVSLFFACMAFANSHKVINVYYSGNFDYSVALSLKVRKYCRWSFLFLIFHFLAIIVLIALAWFFWLSLY